MSSDAIRWQDAAPVSPSDRLKALVGAREWIRAGLVGGALITDLMLLLLGCYTGALVRFDALATGHVFQLLLTLSPAFVLASLLLGGYRISVLRSKLKSAGLAVLAVGIAVGIALAIAFALQVTASISRIESVTAVLSAMVYMSIGRAIGGTFINFLRDIIDPIVIVLTESSAERRVQGHWLIEVDRRGWSPNANDPQFLTEIFEVVRHSDRVLLMFSNPAERKRWAHIMRLTGVDAEIVDPEFASTMPLAIGHWKGNPTLVISRGPLSLGERVLKRGMDLAFVLVSSPIALPLIGVAALLVRLETPGPALFAQERVGRNNRRYKCYKLRSMRSEAIDAMGNKSTDPDDDRVTRIGRLLRRTSIDELPQLWNVLTGQMSLVGPRPHALGSTAEGALFWEAVDGYWVRHSVKPGITGLAQTRGLRGATRSREDIEKRVAADIEYINNWSIWLDIKLLMKTLGVAIHKNAF